MTNQNESEELKEIIKFWIENLLDKEDFPHIVDIDRNDIQNLTLRILSVLPKLGYVKKSEIGLDVEILKVIMDKELANNIHWRHIDFPDDFDYDRIISTVLYDLSRAIASNPEVIKYGEKE